jgi:hypothetical protein
MGKVFSRFKRSLLLTAIIVWTIAAHGAAANDCLSPSPTTLKGGDPYGSLNPRELTPSEHQKLIRLFKSLNGDWQGTANTFFCRSSSDPSDVVLGHETIEATVNIDRNGNLYMRAEFYSERRRTKSRKKMWLFLNNQLLRYNNDSGEGDVELTTVLENQVAFLYRRILQSVYGGSTRQEFFISLMAIQNGFRIEERLYVQGRLSSGHTWQFNR